jgi:2-amino-4-hydroxy-6-hydroxymethyldihydropteridine diphosphokinase
LNKLVYLSLGSNLGQREEHLERALALLEREQVHVVARSSIYETEPQDITAQPWFLNLAVACETQCFPMQLIAIVLRIERELGRILREHGHRYAAADDSASAHSRPPLRARALSRNRARASPPGHQKAAARLPE